ncbi:hypothetical protein GCM10009775_24620 [Microbacterium aoyamense]|uniref:Polyketide cyclase / dehydrase and lipid transport n=1 Tax=Microbacterium aoyamense TaxID=344166 RepID=A0ABN2PSY5_9MICO|nr:hypothetical protein [Microbacterium aoyamense]
MAAAYSFVSRWRVGASADRCWSEIERMLAPGAGPSWWRGVTLVETPSALEAGERMTLAVRSPLGYRLRVRLAIVDVVPGVRIVAASDGDLRGAGSIEVVPGGADAASIVFHWDVATERPWMNRTAFVLRPVFERAHASVMRAGERGLARALGG